MKNLQIILLIIFLSTSVFTGYSQITDTIIDNRDGKVYKTIKIGDQWWMAENLATTKLRDGSIMDLITENEEWIKLTTPAYSWYYNDEETYKDPYGALYNWYAVNSVFLCPVGWHIPSDGEWKQLEKTLKLKEGEIDKEGIRGNNEGGQLKEVGTIYWNSPNVGATNKSGFTAIPVGHRNWKSGDFIDIGLFGTWWSSTEKDSSYAWRRTLYYNDDKIRRFTSHKRDGFTVRCIKD